MGKSKIEWTQETWNPIVGCSLKSPGCTHCYAMRMAARIEAINAALVAEGKPPQSPQYDGTTKEVNGHTVWTGKLAMAGDNILLAPFKRKKPTTYFVNSMGDLFHEDCPDGWIDRVFAVMELCPQHTFQVLTKRPSTMRDYFRTTGRLNQINGAKWSLLGTPIGSKIRHDGKWMTPALPLPNVWLGISAERQQEADERIPLLLQTPAAIRFISYEPALGPLDLTSIAWGKDHVRFPESDDISDAFSALHPIGGKKLDWVIAGGESGPGARPMHPDWVRGLRDQCAAAGVEFFFKQWGEYAPPGNSEPATHAIFPNGHLYRAGHVMGATDIPDEIANDLRRESGSYTRISRVGKKAAGRLLAGTEHNGMPEIRRSAP